MVLLRSGVFSAGRDAPALRQAGRPPLHCLARPRAFQTRSNLSATLNWRATVASILWWLAGAVL